MSDVRVGQVWEDCDKRMAKRQLRVDRIDDKYAYCCDKRRGTRIRLDRFKPTATGYRLVRDA